MMERFVVKSSSLRPTTLPPPESPFVGFLKRGTLYHDVGRKVETDITLHFLPVAAAGYGGNQATTRTELRFNFRW
jgi:hypothetical protein